MKSKILFLLCLLLLSALLSAQVRLEGNIEGQFGYTKNNDKFNWNMWDPNYWIEGRVYANPAPRTEAYAKFNITKDDNNGTALVNPEFLLTEAHAKYRLEGNNKGFESTLFFRESGPYWTDGSMLGILNTGSVNNNGNGQGVRFDTWYPHNGSLTYVFSDFSGGGSDDIHLLRLRQSYLKNHLFTGLFYQRKNYGTNGVQDYNELIGTDIKWSFGSRYYLNAELATTRVPSDSTVTYWTRELHNGDVGDWLKSNVATQVEFKGMRVGSAMTGHWYINPGVFNYGRYYRNYMGNNQDNRLGYYINSYYFVPMRAITLTVNYNYNRKQERDLIHGTTYSYEPVSNLYNEVYVEFLNGFKGKFYYNYKQETYLAKDYLHQDFFSEVSVENRRAKLLAQYKIKDIGTQDNKQIVGIETSINLTDRWRLFTRGMVVNNRSEANHSFFGELQYRPGNNMELYLQYGPSYWGQYGLVQDDSFAGGGKMSEEVKLIIKGWF